jgi:hypothetical protein
VFAKFYTARGTSEAGPFGVIVGGPLVNNVVTEMPGARGYAVQVIFIRIMKITTNNFA